MWQQQCMACLTLCTWCMSTMITCFRITRYRGFTDTYMVYQLAVQCSFQHARRPSLCAPLRDQHKHPKQHCWKKLYICSVHS